MNHIQFRKHQTIRREYGTRDGHLETSVTRIALIRAIGELPEGYRVIFLLHEVEGYQHREIAGLLGCSVGTSKSQLHKAKLRIRDLLTRPRRHKFQLVCLPGEVETRERLRKDRDRYWQNAAVPPPQST